MLPEATVLDRAPGIQGPEGENLEALQATARELERGGDWAAALMTYELVLLQTERTGREPDPRLFIKLGDLLVKTDCPGVAVAMFERAAARFAADGAHQSVIALGIKILRTDRRRQDVFVRFAKQLLEHGFVEEARLVLIDYAERAWARTALRTLKRLENAPTDQTLHTLRRLIEGVEASFVTTEMRGESVVAPLAHFEHQQTIPDGAAASEKPDQPQDRAAVEAIRPRHRGLWSAGPQVRAAEVAGASSTWPRAAALPAGAAELLLQPDRALPAAAPEPEDTGPSRLAVFRAAFAGIARSVWSTLAARISQGLATRLPRWVPATLVMFSAGLLVAPPVYRAIRAGAAPDSEGQTTRALASSAPLPALTTTVPVYTGGGFRSVRDTAITPIRWEGTLVDVPPAIVLPPRASAGDSLPIDRP